jgi:hypothetical protein
MLLAYGIFHRDHRAAEYFRAVGGLELAAMLGLMGAWLSRKSTEERLGRFSTIAWLATAYCLWAFASAGYLWLDGRPWKDQVAVQCFRLLNCAMVVWMGALASPTRQAHGWLSFVATLGSLLPGVLYPEQTYMNHVTATIVAITLPLALHALVTVPSVAVQIFLALALTKLGGMLYVSQSRSAVAGAGAGLVAYALLSRHRWWLLGLGVPAGLLVWRFSEGSFLAERFAALFQRQPGWDTGRVELWNYAMEVFRTFPLVGMGPGTGPEGANDVHNSYLAVLSETGAVGLALYLLFWLAMLIVLACVIVREGNSWQGSAGKALLASIVAHLVIGFGYSLHAMQLAFLLAGCGLALAACSFGSPGRRLVKHTL